MTWSKSQAMRQNPKTDPAAGAKSERATGAARIILAGDANSALKFKGQRQPQVIRTRTSRESEGVRDLDPLGSECPAPQLVQIAATQAATSCHSSGSDEAKANTETQAAAAAAASSPTTSSYFQPRVSSRRSAPIDFGHKSAGRRPAQETEVELPMAPPAASGRPLPRPMCSLLVACVLLAGCVLAASPSGQQHFEYQPEAQYLAPLGQDVRMRCIVRHRQGDCLWLRNGRNIGSIRNKYIFSRAPDDGDCSLMVRNVSVALDDGKWQCQVTAPEVEQDTLQSREAELMVIVAPERPQLKNLTQSSTPPAKERVVLEENKKGFVVCEIRGGNPAPQIEWYLDSRNVTKEATTSSASSGSARLTSSRLRISDMKRALNGKNLTCVGVHQTINQSTSAELDVQYVPTVSVVQREYSIVEGSPLTVSCQVDANPAPNLINWRLVNEGPSRAGATPISQPSRSGPSLEFERVSREQNQNVYECLASNALGVSAPADVRLNVLFAPQMLNTSSSESVSVGSSTQLACLFEGNPEPEIHWHYVDPLSKSPAAVRLDTDNLRGQTLSIRNVTYRNEGDYHCEAVNQINGVRYGLRSPSILLDIFGEPQLLARSPQSAKATQGQRSDVAVSFCADPPPTKAYWQFGSLRLDVRLNNINNGHQQAPSSGPQAPAGGAKQNHISQRYLVHPLQPLQRRDSAFSKTPTCFEATLTLLDPELTDQRDYTLVVHNERGHQAATVRLRVSSPLSPVLMITGAFLTISGLFLCSLVAIFLVKKRAELMSAAGGGGGGGQANGLAGQKLAEGANGNALANGKQQQTRGVVNGLGNGLGNGAANPQLGAELSGQNSLVGLSPKVNEVSVDAKIASPSSMHGAGAHLMSMASSDTSGDQKQLLASSSERNSSSSGSSPNHCGLVEYPRSTTAGSSPVPMNHISVDDDDGIHSTTYQAAESVTNDVVHELSPRTGARSEQSALIYANLNYSDHLGHHPTLSSSHHYQSPSIRSMHSQQQQQQQLAESQSPAGLMHEAQLAARPSSPRAPSSVPSSQQQVVASASPAASPKLNQLRSSSVGATIAMMNSLAAAAAASTSPALGPATLVGAIGQQMATAGGKVRKPGPPKPPKPSIQQRSRFYQQQAAGIDGGGLVMIGTGLPAADTHPSGTSKHNNELAAEYSRLAFATRAEL